MINGHNAMIGPRPRVATNVRVRMPLPPAPTPCVTRHWRPSLRLAQALAVPLVPVVPRVHAMVRPRRLRRRKFSAQHARHRVPAALRWTDAPRKTTETVATRALARQ